ncbi:MAG: hypothetical protein IKP86_01900 [Anaerolineaceae bacterium]|nr:hypothetical protein [Anaerolineaceae bacterium]
MKNKLFFILSALILLTAFSVAASGNSTVLVTERQGYICGDMFEISFPEVIATSSMISNASQVHAEAAKDERLLQVRIKLRNLTSSVFYGISPNSFTLTGYVRNRSLSYDPELILNTDYFGSGNYYSWDRLPPLRMADILLIFRVNPILINWELSFEPQLTGEPSYVLDTVQYEPAAYEPCSATFQFPAVKKLETGEITRFNRK